ncbi:MAG: hypothetical protein HUU08_15475 [Candidatus Brocadia sp.]|nr:hypothetical protein [Candidatus Brocadia sp.]
MSLTSNFDYCVQLGLTQVKEIFHLAFKSEDRYPHNVGPIVENFSGREVIINVKVLDDEDRAANLSFQDEKHILFSFPFDLTVETKDAPDPSLSRFTMRVRVEIPALLTYWEEEGEEVLGLDFASVTPADVNIVILEGLPVVNIPNIRTAIHQKYDLIEHIYSQDGSSLVLYDDTRDASLVPPNSATPFDIEADLETHGATDYLKITAPIHVDVPLPIGGIYRSYGRIVFWREFIQTDTTITIDMSSEPAEAALATSVELDDVAAMRAAELAGILFQIHTAYDAVTHTHTFLGNTLVLYDDNRDPDLTPENLADPYNIEAEFESHSGIEYLKVILPIHVRVPLAVLFSAYGRVIFWREVDRTDTTLSVNMGVEPADVTLATTIELDSDHPAKGIIITQLTPLAISALAGFGIVSGQSFGVVISQLNAQAIIAINNFGVITEPAFSESAARSLLQHQISDYIKVRRYPVFTPKSGDPAHPLSTPIGFLLVTDGVLAILMNRRTGTEADDHAPDNFLGSNDLALAIGRARVDEIITEAVNEEFPGVNNGGHEISTEEGDATLFTLNIAPSNAGTHDESRGHLWVTGTAEVHIDCWPDPDVDFEGPIFLNATETEEDGVCTLNIEPQVGDFDFDQSCCDIFIDIIIPIVGWIMLAIIEDTIDEVGGELAGEIAAGQAEHIEAIPPVINGIAEVQACLIDLNITSEGFILPGTVTIRRLGRSFEDLEGDHDLPRP